MAIWPEPSIVDVALISRLAADDLPIQAILLPLIATAPLAITRFLPSIVTTSHPLSSRSAFKGAGIAQLFFSAAWTSCITEKSQSLSIAGRFSRPDALAAAYIGPARVSR